MWVKSTFAGGGKGRVTRKRGRWVEVPSTIQSQPAGAFGLLQEPGAEQPRESREFSEAPRFISRLGMITEPPLSPARG